MIKSTTIYIKGANKQKAKLLALFCSEYRNAVAFYVKYYFSTKFPNISSFSNAEALKTPKFYPFDIEPQSKLSARALKCAKTQAIGLISAATKKQASRVYMLQKLLAEGKPTKNLLRAINKTRIQKPKIPQVLPAELNSIIMSCSSSETKHFDLAFNFQCLFNSTYKTQIGLNKFVILANKHKHFNSLAKRGEQMTSFLVTKNYIQIRFEIPQAPKQKTGLVLGIDQGASTCISCSSASGTYFASSQCPHGHDLKSIMQKLSRKKKGSNAFKRTQAHRTNYINYCINQLNLNGVAELRLEKIYNLRKGRTSSRYLSHFTYTEIQQKLQDACTQNGVRFVLQESPYRSQRCSSCGFVCSSNRVSKTFKCKSCGFTADADLNASANHVVDLPDLDRSFIGNYNKSGFLWNPGFNGPYSAI